MPLLKKNLNMATLPWFRAMFGTPATRSGVMRSKRPLPATFETDVRILHDKVRRRYYLTSVPCRLRPRVGAISKLRASPPPAPAGGVGAPAAAPPARQQRQLALDPGVRTFMTGYDPTGLAIEWGCGQTNARLWRLANTANGIRARAAKPEAGHRKRRHMRREPRRASANMVDELHHKFAAWACANYDLILLPEFQVKGMARKGRRRIGKKTVSSMYTLAHYPVPAVHSAQGQAARRHAAPRRRGLHVQDVRPLRQDARGRRAQALRLSVLRPHRRPRHRRRQERRPQARQRQSVSAAEGFFKKKAVPLAGSGAASYRLAGGSFREELPRCRNCSMKYS